MRSTCLAVFLLVSLCTTLTAAEMQVKRDLPYVASNNDRHARHRLDVYYPAAGKDHPIMIWLHGGGWTFGDKRSVQEKPQAFVDRGFVFVSINYRFVPEVTMDQIAADVAAAIGHVQSHADKVGGDPGKIFVGGHSAGAHLAALVCTDPRYLAAEGMKLSDIAGCIPVDSACYDAARLIAGIKLLAPRRGTLYTDAFGEDAASQRKFSPITYVAKDQGIPPFCLLYVADRPDARRQSAAFAEALDKAGIEAVLVPGEDKTHATINRELGHNGDKPTAAVFKFLDEHAK